MTDNRPYKHCLIFALILILGLGLALALPWLANSQGLAAHENPGQSANYAELILSGQLNIETFLGDFDNAPKPTDLCFATYNDGALVYASINSSAVQDAVNAASSGDTVKVAGTCVGVTWQGGLHQTVYISKSLTLEGGHTPSDWTLEPDPDAYMTALYAYNEGRVIVISGTQDVTLESLFLTKTFTNSIIQNNRSNKVE